MRILHVAPYFPPGRLGGVGEYVARLHRALLAAGHASEVVTRGTGSEPGVHRIARTAPGWWLALPGQARRARGFDVVHVHAGEALPLLLALGRGTDRPRVVATWHVHYAGVADALAPYTLEGRRFGGGFLPWIERHVVARAHRVVDRWTLPRVDAVVPITRACARELLGPERSASARVIHHGLPEPKEDADAPAPEPVELLYVGAPGHRKRVHALPSVLHRVRSVHPGARLRIVGFAPEGAPALARAFAERGLADAVDWTGPVPAEALGPFYRSADVLVVPSAYEGLPLVVVEAMQQGLPVVATRVSGHPEAIESGETGLLVPLDDPPAMAEACVALLDDPARRERMGAAARRVARERFGMERHLAEYLALYQELCGDPA